jgi:thioredoxin-like negative regulator of GroEL
MADRDRSEEVASVSSSIHVPASVVQRIVGVARWLMPILATGLTGVLGLGWGWIASRTSLTEVAPKIAEVNISAKAAQSAALTCEVEAKMAHALALETARTQLETWAVSEVDRQYSRSPRRGEFIERARRFYGAAFDTFLEKNPNDPATALRRARQAIWRPDRED